MQFGGQYLIHLASMTGLGFGPGFLCLSSLMVRFSSRSIGRRFYAYHLVAFQGDNTNICKAQLGFFEKFRE